MTIEEKFQELKKMIKHAGETARAYFDSEDVANDLKHDGTVVTQVDQSIERMLRDYIINNFPGDAIVGEEEEAREGKSGFVWHIDPIDGTDNFLRRIPFCAVSVARLGDTQEDSFGIVYNPITGQMFSSLMDNGVFENERVHNLNSDFLGGKGVISMGRGQEPWMKTAMYNLIKTIAMDLGACRAYGSCALELAYVAANRIDGELIFGLHSWDWAAGIYLIKAGGGTISVFEDGAWQIWEGSLKELCSRHDRILFASHAGVHQRVLGLVGDPHKWADLE